MVLKVKLLNENATVPKRGSDKASGLDLACLEDITLYPKETRLIRTGVAFEIPEGYEIQVRARSGLSLKTDFRIANGIGTVDQDYTGECCVIGWNHGNRVIEFKAGDRIAQAILCPVVLPTIEVIDSIKETERGSDGFGSTDKKK